MGKSIFFHWLTTKKNKKEIKLLKHFRIIDQNIIYLFNQRVNHYLHDPLLSHLHLIKSKSFSRVHFPYKILNSFKMEVHSNTIFL